MLNRLSDLVRLRAYADMLVQPVGKVAMTTLRDLSVGSLVTAYIELARADGSARAMIDGQPVELNLPFNARAGDSIALRVAAQDPQLRFTLDAGADAAPQLANLSDTARFITALLAESEKLPVAKLAAGGPALLAGAPHDSHAIAIALKSALADSGMFYEAHQTQWINEERPLAALLREPQARLRPLTIDDNMKTSALDVPQLKELPAHRDALTIVRQQLETLETHQVTWQGTLWPGQTIEWQVGEQPSNTGAGNGNEPEWQSRLRLTLPRLGGIEATLVVSARGVRVSLRTDSETSATTLDENRSSLHNALADAGVPPLGIGVVYAGA